MIAHVRLRLFSGWPNPEWTLDDPTARKLAATFGSLRRMTDQPKPQPRLGYRGLTLTLVTGDSAPATITIYKEWVTSGRLAGTLLDARREFEAQVYKTAPREVLDEVHHMSFAQLIQQGTAVPIAGLNPPDAPKAGCPNAPTAPGSKDWITHAGYNNCYNYANDVLNTDEWADIALPGTLTKMPASTKTSTVRGTLRAAILKDSLTRVAGDKVPSTCPSKNRHYMAVVIRHHPASAAVQDFHCFRLDADGTWSHKDASGEPRNTDDAGIVIGNLTQAQFDGNPVLVGVYRARKNNTKIG